MAFEYPLAQFVPFRDAAACARVRAITRVFSPAASTEGMRA